MRQAMTINALDTMPLRASAFISGTALIKKGCRLTVGLLVLSATLAAQAQSPDHEEFLPPETPWSGKSEDLVVSEEDPWITPAERLGLESTPGYQETVDWMRRLVDSSSRLEMISIGTSAEDRDIWMVVASAEGGTTPGEFRSNGKPTVLAHSGIHAGEIDGKDAGLMLLRDMTTGRRNADLLDAANFLFIPILSVDGHERMSPTNRINQRGPSEMGWRTNARNLNVNRDFTKLETREVRALVNVFEIWSPDLYIDLHVTDGADYQYDVTYGFNGKHAWSPAISEWLSTRFRPSVDAALERMGHVPGQLIFSYNERDMSDGNQTWTAPARFSTGYADLRHLPTVIVENHSLKSYRRRVLGTYVFLEVALRTVAEYGDDLRDAARRDRARRTPTVTLNWEVPEGSPPEKLDFKGIRSATELSPVTGGSVVRWTGEPVELVIADHRMTNPAQSVSRPDHYYIPAAWSHITARLREHGVEVEVLDATRVVRAQMYRLPDAAPADPVFFEGRARVSSGDPVVEERLLELRPGSAVVTTDQPLGDLVVVLLEPQADDSFFSWGYFLEIMQRTEYAEAYVMEPMARRMLEQSEDLRQEFEQRVQNDTSFAANPAARLDWFYRRTPYFDSRWRLYPIGRSLEESGR